MKNILLCSEKMSDTVIGIFRSLQYDIAYIPKCRSLSGPVSSHPDMLFSLHSDSCILTDRNYYLANEGFFKFLEEKGIKFCLSERKLSEKYPFDILFDAIKTDKILIGNLKYTAPELFTENIKAVNVRQGYALCSTLLMKDAAVSADKGICDALVDNGYDVLKISPGNIVLDGYDCGFIGGASAVLEERRAVVFFGNIEKHPDGGKIVRFCESKGYGVYFDGAVSLTDLGGVKAL